MRAYRYREDSGYEEIADHQTDADAMAWAESLLDGGDYGVIESTTWVDARLDVRTGESWEYLHTITAQIDPEEPACTGGSHDWQSPHDLVGGLVENPGVWGHGGGVIIHEACMRCGCGRITDTWAQRPDTGEQGLESVEYAPDRYAVSP